jgi:2-aminoethylphosphonate-pyruvate transaminase
MRSRVILLNPGPVTLSERVRRALTGPDLCHREAEFSQLQETIRGGLLRVYGLAPGRWAAVLLTGSGTAAVEAMLSSLVPKDGKLLVIENGVYGERMRRIAETHGIGCVSVKHGWGEEVGLERLEAALAEADGLTHVAVVHHETTTGRLNRLDRIGAICRARGLTLLVDGVSSFGAEELDFEGWGIAACAATANKCLHGVPGTCFVIVRREALPGGDSPLRTLYLDLPTYCREQDRGGTPFTQSVQTLYALSEALAELEEEGGWPARRERYRRLIGLVREGLAAMGIAPVLPEGASSVVLNAFRLPDGISYGELHDRLKDEGFVIYAGQGGLANSIFRVSTMGAIDHADMARFLAATGGIVARRAAAIAGRKQG